MKSKNFVKKENTIIIIVLFAITVLASIPLFHAGIHYGHDLHFHLMRIEALVAEIQRGTFPVYIPKIWMDGYGYPSSIYYGEWTLYLPVVLRLCGMNLTVAYKVYVFFNNIALVFISYISFFNILEKKVAAILSTLLYATASYRFLDMYVRAAVGEYTAMIFLPLILWAVWEIFTKEDLDKSNVKRLSWIFAIGMSGVLTTHVLSFFMTCILLIALCIICVKKTFSKSVFFTITISAIKTMALSAFFWIPLFDYILHVKTYTGATSQSEMYLEGAYISEILGFFKSSYITGETTFNKTPGAALLLALFVSIIIICTHKTSFSFKLLALFNMALIFFASSYFPWNRIAGLGSIGRLFVSVQFPWRWFEFSCILLALLGGFVVKYISAKKICDYCMISMVILATFTGVFNQSDYANKAQLAQFNDIYDLDTRYISGGEYLIFGTNYFEMSPYVTGEGLSEYYAVSDSPMNGTYYCESVSDSAFIEVPIFNYKGYIAKTDTDSTLLITSGDNNRIRIIVPNEFKGKITVTFKPPILWILGLIVTVITLIIMFWRVSYFVFKERFAT